MVSDKYTRNMAWFDRIGIDKSCRFVASCRGCINLTRIDDDTHTLWLFDWRIYEGDAGVARRMYAALMLDDPFARYYG